mgnify:CR=1 FL=1
MGERRPFLWSEMLLGTLFTLGVDIIAALIDLTGIGVAIAPVIQSFATFSLTMWFRSKGDPNATKLGKQLVRYALNLLPVSPLIITTFTTTIPFLIMVYIHNHPERFAAIEKLAGGAKGGTKLPGVASAK